MIAKRGPCSPLHPRLFHPPYAVRIFDIQKQFVRNVQLIASRRAPPPSSSKATPASASSPSRSTASTSCTSPIRCLFPRFVLRFRRVVDEESIQGERVGEDVVSDGRAADVDGVEADGVAALGRHFDSAEGGVHLGGDGGDGAVEDGTCRVFVSEVKTPADDE